MGYGKRGRGRRKTRYSDNIKEIARGRDKNSLLGLALDKRKLEKKVESHDGFILIHPIDDDKVAHSVDAGSNCSVTDSTASATLAFAELELQWPA